MANNNTMNAALAAQLLKLYVLKRKPAFLWGAPGVGKSDVVRQLRDLLTIETGEKWGFIDFRAALRDPVDLKGLPVQKKNFTDWLIPNELPQVERDGKFGILFADELPQAMQAMQNAMFGLVLDRCVGNYRLPDGWVVVAAGNRQSDRSGANATNLALDNRFKHITIEVDLDAWIEWAIKANIHPSLIAFHRFRRDKGLLHVMPKDKNEHAFPTPRSWVDCAEFVDAPIPLRQRAFEGAVGEGAAAEYEGFLRIWQGLPSLDGVIADPASAHVPDMTNPGQLYAVAGALARRADAKSFVNILKYATRFPTKEFELMMVHDIVMRLPELKQTQAFINFATANQDFVS